jgi:hypothetical protein
MFQRSEIQYLRKLLEQCDLCSSGKNWNKSVTDNCLQFMSALCGVGMAAQANQAATWGNAILRLLFQYF